VAKPVVTCNPYPTLVYVLEGSIEVAMDSGIAHGYKAGDSFLMVVNTWTNAKNKGTMPAKVLVVYVGVHGKPNLVRPQ
jgi:quercetin dioxygenase-like cupin family protein